MEHGKHRRISAVSMACAPGEHIYALAISYRDNHDDGVLVTTVSHGGRMPDATSKDYHHIELGKDEWIDTMDIFTWRHKGAFSSRTRVGQLMLSTNKDRGISCGTQLDGGSCLFVSPKKSYSC